MVTYVLKFVLCSGLLLLAYQLLLKNKTTYIFNRFYLLLSITFSMLVPLLVITQPAGIPGSVKLIGQANPQTYYPFVSHIQPNATPPLQANYQYMDIDYTPYIAIGVYVIIVLAFLYRFIKNLSTILHSISDSNQVIYKNTRLILIEEKLIPHTFLKNIFINKDEYRNNLVTPEVLKHELTHARQLHSIDVIFIELLQAFYWFNPFIFLYKRAIQLNHEFIADAAAVNDSNSITAYQYLLLGKVSGLPTSALASQFNYSVTKKRLIMMTKNTSAGMAILARLSVIPVIAAAFLLFCTKTQAQQQPQDTAKKKQSAAIIQPHPKWPIPIPPHIVGQDNYPHNEAGVPAGLLVEYANITAKYKDKFTVGHKIPELALEDRNRLETIYKQMSFKQQAKQMICFFYAAPPAPPFSPSQKQLSNWADPKLYGVWIDDKKVDNSELAKYKPEDFSSYFSSRLTPRAIHHKDYKYQVDLMTNAYYKNYRDEKIKNRFESIIYFRSGNGFKG